MCQHNWKQKMCVRVWWWGAGWWQRYGEWLWWQYQNTIIVVHIDFDQLIKLQHTHTRARVLTHTHTARCWVRATPIQHSCVCTVEAHIHKLTRCDVCTHKSSSATRIGVRNKGRTGESSSSLVLWCHLISTPLVTQSGREGSLYTHRNTHAAVRGR